MNGPVINKIFLDCPFGGDKNLDSGRTNVTTKVRNISFLKIFHDFSFKLNELKGGVVFSVVGTTGVTPNIIFTMGCEVDGQQYQGKLIFKIVLEFHEKNF